MYVLSVKTQNELAFFKCFSLENMAQLHKSVAI